VNTGIANAKAIAASPLTFGQPWVTINTISGVLAAASAVAAGVKAIQQINSAESGTPASAPQIKSGASSAAGVAAPVVAGASAPQIQTGGGQNPSSQIVSTLAESRKTPIKTYVVASDMSSQQAFDRRTNNAATF
jgi:negative regulator of sigma E activity